jgi:hypothetical protein
MRVSQLVWRDMWDACVIAAAAQNMADAVWCQWSPAAGISSVLGQEHGVAVVVWADAEPG